MSILETTVSREVALGGPVAGYYVRDERGDYFVTSGDANIIRLDMAFNPSGKWRAVCVYNARGKVLSDWATFAQVMAGDKPMAFKNGKPMYHLGDLDHGTNRMWGSGLRSIRRATAMRQQSGFWEVL